MPKPRRIALVFVLVILLVAVLALGAAWAMARRALPEMNGTLMMPELKQEVVVTRDHFGIPRITAASLEDLVTAQGYVMAQDRMWQMDLIRRNAAGELAEIFGSVALPIDREYRTLGLKRAADRDVTLIDSESRMLLDAYARGVNRYLVDHRNNLPIEFRVLGYQPAAWQPRDTLLVSAYMFEILSTSWEAELKRAKVTARVGPEVAREMYIVESERDIVVVGSDAGTLPVRKAAQRLLLPPRTFSAQLPWRDSLDAGDEESFGPGSNNWVVSGAHTASGKPQLANDTHLPLNVPCIFSIMQLVAPGWNVKGFALPGSPLIIIGQNEHIAWGFTNNGADVQDPYIEQLNPANPHEYRVKGEWVKAEVRQETLRVRGGSDETLEVVVTRHGPVVAREGNLGYALRWTATEPGNLWVGVPRLGGAQNWAEFREVLRTVPGPAQNIVFADRDGNIGYAVAAKIPIRKGRNGSVPMPGDTDDNEWTGYIPFDQLPVAFNPASGRIVTANSRVVGRSYPYHLTDRWVAAYRTARIDGLLREKSKLIPADHIAVQADLLSTPHRLLASHLLAAAKTSAPADARTREMIARLANWDARAEVLSREMTFVEMTRRIARRRILSVQLGSDAALYDWFRSEEFFQNVLRDRQEHWLPKEFRVPGRATALSFDAFLLSCADEAVKQLSEDARGGPSPAAWSWGKFNPLEMFHPLGRAGFLRGLLGVGPLPQPGATHTVKQTGRSFGPAIRFVADLGNPDNSLMNITLGESGQLTSPHYRDQFPYWYEARGLASGFSADSVNVRVAHRLKLVPANR